MGLLKHFRSRSKLNSPPRAAPQPVRNPAPYYDNPGGIDCTEHLPVNVLRNIFAQVCPHSQDGAYTTSEKSQVGDGCMLCDLRDIAQCARVRRNWYQIAQETL